MKELALDIDDTLGKRAGVERALREAIRSGRLAVGSSLPSSRVLAADLGFSRATVVDAYEQLTAEGYLTSQQGVGTTVADVYSPPAEATQVAPAERRLSANFLPGEPDGSLFPRRSWLRSSRRVVSAVADQGLGYPDARGVVDLRSALAGYLGRARSVVATPDAVSVFGGFFAAIGFLGELFVRRGLTTIAVEDPGLPITREVVGLVGCTTVPVAVDEEGIDVDALDRSGARVVVVTPGHQFPLGMPMSPARRSALVEWAHRRDGWIIEDDYDGEFRYDRQPVGALQGLDPQRVIYAGTASKSLVPGLRIGWLVVPSQLRAELAAVKHIRGATSVIEQLTLSDFIESGELDRHLRAVRGAYRRRQSLLVERLADSVPALGLRDHAAGLHLTGILPSEVDEGLLVHAASEHGVGLVGLASFFAGLPTRGGLVLGYSRPPEHQFHQALDRLIEFLAAQLGPRR